MEYLHIESADPRIKYVHPTELAKNWKQYAMADFIVTYSSYGKNSIYIYSQLQGVIHPKTKVRCLFRSADPGCSILFEIILYNHICTSIQQLNNECFAQNTVDLDVMVTP